MAALATLFKSYGIDVSGCDREEYIFTQDILDEKNIKYYKDVLYDDYDFVVRGNSYSKEVDFLCPIYKYVDVLKYLSLRYISIAVSGSHGKTTTTGMIATILGDEEAYLIGDGNGRLDINSKYFVFEACEYKRNFLNYEPNIILINNIELDHVDYFKNIDDYVLAFKEFKDKGKVVIVNGDDKYLSMFDNCLKFGFNENNDLIITKYIQEKEKMTFSFTYKEKTYDDIELNLYGKHQLFDAVGAIFVGLYIGLDIDIIINRLNSYKFNKRRFNEELIGSNVIIDDYGHQPSQIKATFNSIDIKYKDKNKVCIYKPDRYSRLYYFKDEFDEALSLFDEAYICSFPSCSISDLNFKFDVTDLVNDNIKYFDEINFSLFENRKNTVFLVTSSKLVNNIKEGIKERIKDD